MTRWRGLLVLAGLVAALTTGALPGAARAAEPPPPASPQRPEPFQAPSFDTRLGAALREGRIAAAFELADSSIAWRRRVLRPAPLRVAGYLDSLGQAFFPIGRAESLAAADSFFRRALELREKHLPPDDLDVAGSLSTLATVRDYQGRWADALGMERRALRIRVARQGEGSAPAAACRRQIGAFLYYLGEYAESEHVLGQAISTMEALDHPDTSRLVDAWNALAEVQRVQDRYDEAERSFRHALAMLGSTGTQDLPTLAVLQNNLAGLLKDQARYDEAEPLLRESLSIRQAEEPPQAEALATGHLNVGEVYRLQGRPEEAEPHYAEALRLARGVFGADNANLIIFLNQAAALHESLGHPAEAERLYREGLALAEATLEPRNPLVAQVLQDIGELRLSSGRASEARAVLERALAIREERFGPASPTTAVTRLSLVKCLEADSTSEPSLLSAQVERVVTSLEASDAFLEARVDAYALRARRSDRRGDRDSAIVDLARAVALLDTLRRVRGGGDDVRTRFFAGRQEVFDRLVGWLAERDDISRAFEVHERSRARQLLDEIDGAGVNLRAGIPADVLAALDAEERAARHRLAAVQRQIAGLERDPEPTAAQRLERLERLTAARDSAAWQLGRARQSAKERSPIWREVLSKGGVVASLEEVQRSLVTAGRVALVYRIGEHGSHLFVVPPAPRRAQVVVLGLDSAAARELGGSAGPLTAGALVRVFDSGPARRPLRARVGLSALLATSEPPDDDRAGATRWRNETDRRLEHLGRTLLPDSIWRQVRQAELAIVIPDASLHLLPFDALMLRPGRGRRAPVFWLDEGPPILYASTATSMIRLMERDKRSPRGARGDVAVLSVADPSFGVGDVAMRGIPAADAPGDAGGGLGATRAGRGTGPMESHARVRDGAELLRQLRSPLPGARTEARAIRRAFAPDSVRIIEGAAATEGAVRAALTGAPYLHFGTHGFVTHRRGEVLAGLVLAESDASNPGSIDDGLLQLYEIYELPVACELAVLSACVTHRGPQVPGEGVFPLSRGFVVAGARRVVATLWPVSDRSTARLVAELFASIARVRKAARAPDYARALRDAKRATRAREQWDRPSSWAPFVLVGRE